MAKALSRRDLIRLGVAGTTLGVVNPRGSAELFCNSAVLTGGISKRRLSGRPFLWLTLKAAEFKNNSALPRFIAQRPVDWRLRSIGAERVRH
jgi:hypothetical protein